MDQLSHIRTLFSIIVGLSLTHLLKGFAKIIEAPGRNKIYKPHLLWAFFLLMMLVDFWWWEFRLMKVESWNFALYSYIILYVTNYYITCVLIFPEDLSGYDGYRGYYYSRKKWIFGLMALLFVLDIGDTLIKGQAYYHSLGTEYPIRIAAHVVLCLIAAFTKKEWYHKLLVIVLILYNLSWIYRQYFVQ